MSDVVNRNDPTIWLRSVNTPDYPPENWVINPDMISEGLIDANGNILVPKKYWKISGDSVVEMSQMEKDATPGDEITEGQLKHTMTETSDGKVSQMRYYTDEMVSASGFSGFSGLGKATYYEYSGYRLMGFSTCRFDTKGNISNLEITRLSSGPDGEIIARKVE